MAKNTGMKYELCVKWTSELPYIDTPRESPKIPIRQDSDWFLRLSYRCDYYTLHLVNEVCKELEKCITVTTYVQDCAHGTPFLMKVTRVEKSGVELWSENKSSLSDHIGNFLEVGKFTLICIFHDSLESDIEIISEKTKVSLQTDSIDHDLQHLSRDFSSFMKDETFSDVKLKCGDSTFSAHKSVLVARSEVFAAMFRNTTVESKTGVVDIQDMDPDVLESLLQYIYSGEKPDLCQGIAHRLYEAADEYAVCALKKTCSEFMVEDMTLENCLDLLVLGDEHADEDFKQAVSSFVAKRLHLLSRETWFTFKKEHPELAVAVYDKCCKDALSGQT